MAVNISTLTGGTLNTVALAAPIDDANRDVVMRLFQKMATVMPWITYDPVGTAALALNQQSYPYPAQSIPNPPVWLSNVDRLEIWNSIAKEFVPITQAILSSQLQQARVAGEALDRNVAFWNAISRYSGADAVQKAWDDLWSAIAAFKAQRTATRAVLDVTKPIIAQYGPRIPAALIQKNSTLEAQYVSLSNNAAAALAPLGASARSAAGLGVAPLIIAGIAASAVVAITASVWAIAHEFATVQEQANSNAQEILKAREAADQADFSTGKITNEQLVQRRTSNVNDATKLVDAEGAAAVGGALGKAGFGVAAGIGALALLGLGAFFLLKKKS